jgi:cell division control protein 6
MPSFKEMLSEKSIFRNKESLSPHFVPETLLFRESEVRQIMEGLLPALKDQKPHNIFIYGGTGTGKTACARSVIEKLEREGHERIKPVYMNCRVYDTRYKVLQRCISNFNPDFAKTGFSFSVLYERMLDWVEGDGDHVQGKRVVVALDELDMVKDLDSLIYTLTRANDDLKKGSVSIIGISNKVNFKVKLDARSKSALCERELVFQPYNAQQLQGILRQRIPKAFEDEAVIDESGINLAAAIAAAENGDARYALLLLQRAGELADLRKTKLTDKEVSDARKQAEEDKAFEVISTLPEHQQIFLLALSSLSLDGKYKRLVEEGGERYYLSGETYERYCQFVKKMGKEPRTSRWLREYINELDALGLVNSLQSGKGVRGRTTLVRLAYEPDRVKRAVETTLISEQEQPKPPAPKV